MAPAETLLELIAADSRMSVPAPITALIDAARARHGHGVAAVLVYGSCLRAQDVTDKIADLYLLADSYRAVHGSRLARLLNAVLPPNVYYLEAAWQRQTVRAKYAIVTLDQLERLVAPGTVEPYFWARFAQPTAIAWARDEATVARVQRLLARAATTMIAAAAPLLPAAAPAAELWSRAFLETYRTELRAEAPGRAALLYQTYAERYGRVLAAARAGSDWQEPDDRARRLAAARWRWRRVEGKLLSVLRLIRNAFTFEDGADYLIWKIQRHSGVQLEVTPWQRRHPILASTVLFWRCYRAGGFR